MGQNENYSNYNVKGFDEYLKQAEDSGVPLDAFDTRCDAIDMVARESRKATADMVTGWSTITAKISIKNVSQV